MLGRSPGEGNGNPLQYSSLENPMDRGPPANAGDEGSTPGWGRSNGEGDGNPL